MKNPYGIKFQENIKSTNTQNSHKNPSDNHTKLSYKIQTRQTRNEAWQFQGFTKCQQLANLIHKNA